MEYFRDLVAPQRMNAGDALFSATRAFKLIMQANGDLVEYVIDDATLGTDITQGQYTKTLWAAETAGSYAAYCAMQADGNLVLYTNNGIAIWASNTNGNPGAFLRCQDDGNLVIYSSGGAVIASSNSYAG